VRLSSRLWGPDVGGACPGHLSLAFELIVETEPVDGIFEDELAGLVAHVLGEEGATGSWEITVAIVHDDRLQALHREFMGVDSPTDILTFPRDDPQSDMQGGDLVISEDHARTQAGTWGMSPADEVRFLVAHGLLHLMGWRDETSEQRRLMLDRQRTLIDSWAE
jgi:probable rRNA maturation factor